jgi:hypothetical protein
MAQFDQVEKPDRPLLSIIVPARDYTYALSLIRGVLAISDGELELVVHDASGDTTLRDYLAQVPHDARLVYHFAGRPMSLYENFNAAVALASGEYVCIVGEDDGVSPEIVRIARWACANGIDAVRDTRRLRYYWPDMAVSPNLIHHAGRLFIDTRYTGKVMVHDLEASARQLMSQGGQDYLSIGLPKVYHGLVRLSSLVALRARSGEYFKGLTPDIYSAVALIRFIRTAATIDYPITVDGTSLGSNAGVSARGGHRGRYESAPHLADRPNYDWPVQVPRFYSVETIWAESAVTAMREIGYDDLLADFNTERLCAACLAAHPDFARLLLPEVARLARQSRDGQLDFLLETARYYGPLAARRLLKDIYRTFRTYVPPRHTSTVELVQIPNSHVAMSEFSAFLDRSGRSFQNSVPQSVVLE